MTATRLLGVAIEGRGPVALALASLLRRQGLPASMLRLSAARGAPPPALAARALALSGGTWQILARIVAAPPPAGRIGTVDIALGGHAPRARLVEADNGGRALGHVVRHGALTTALEAPLAGWRPAAPQEPLPEGWLHVHAEGRIDTSEPRVREFDQHALFTEVRIHAAAPGSLPRPGVAYERFMKAGPLAVLPLPEPDLASIVWCERPARVAQLLDAPAPDFEAALAQALAISPGRLTLAGERHGVPLRSERADDEPPDTVCIGNAAQSLHPVAGQGLNLGMRDAMTLAACVGRAHADGLTVSEVVRVFRRTRERDRALTRAMTDRLAALGAGAAPAPDVFRAATALGIGLLDLVAPVRRQVSRHFVYGLR